MRLLLVESLSLLRRPYASMQAVEAARRVLEAARTRIPARPDRAQVRPGSRRGRGARIANPCRGRGARVRVAGPRHCQPRGLSGPGKCGPRHLQVPCRHACIPLPRRCISRPSSYETNQRVCCLSSSAGIRIIRFLVSSKFSGSEAESEPRTSRNLEGRGGVHVGKELLNDKHY